MRGFYPNSSSILLRWCNRLCRLGYNSSNVNIVLQEGLISSHTYLIDSHFARSDGHNSKHVLLPTTTTDSQAKTAGKFLSLFVLSLPEAPRIGSHMRLMTDLLNAMNTETQTYEEQEVLVFQSGYVLLNN